MPWVANVKPGSSDFRYLLNDLHSFLILNIYFILPVRLLHGGIVLSAGQGGLISWSSQGILEIDGGHCTELPSFVAR